MTNPFDSDTPHNTARVLALYEWLRPVMPAVRAAASYHAPRLRDLLGEFDALLLDGYGVLNVGAEMVPGADLLLAEAAAAGVAVIVVTNGGSKKSTVTAAKYRNLGLDVTNQQVVSSRDALEARLARPQSEIRHLGVVDTWSTCPICRGSRPLC